MKDLNEVLRNIEDGWVIVTAEVGERVVIGGATYYNSIDGVYKLSCAKGLLVECYGSGSLFNVTEIKDNKGNTVWKKPQPRKTGEIRQGDYFVRQDIEEYAESEGLSVKEVYQMLMDKMEESGASRGEGIRHYLKFDQPNNWYGWSNLTNGCYFTHGDKGHLSGEQLSVKEVLGSNEYVQVSKVELERLREIANSLGE